MRTLRVPLRIVFYRESERWVAHCLEFDLCGDGESKAEALEALTEAISIQLHESLEHDNPHNLISPAPSEIQERFFAGRHTASGELKFALERVDHFELGEPEYREYAEDSDLVAK